MFSATGALEEKVSKLKNPTMIAEYVFCHWCFGREGIEIKNTTTMIAGYVFCHWCFGREGIEIKNTTTMIAGYAFCHWCFGREGIEIKNTILKMHRFAIICMVACLSPDLFHV
ncbi:hypothetical protein CEXT_115631 [Caerostris extrusa]|uniref:Uncharacterized protein n=1 Tax=Caerostris extrusa TaxID=172846 RepID=A0AAV4RWL0_CAEEX|nr:hypothetical protein CEXT_115631 [Caerostris extrusa]